MSKYRVNFGRLAVQLLPPDKRRPFMSAWLKALVKPIQYLRDLHIQSFKDGAEVSEWAPGSYGKGERVRYYQSVYDSLRDNNTALPTDSTSWVRVQENFAGVMDRAKYTGQKIVLEYALNKWFDGQFRQPPALSDIYVISNPQPVNGFVVGITAAASSKVGSDGSSEYISNETAVSTVSNLAIMIPGDIYEGIDPDPRNREGIVRSFADRLLPAGIIYEVRTY